MATSGISTGLLKAGDIVSTAYQLLGVFAPEDDVSADRMDMGLKQLNWMLKTSQTDGLNLWRDEDVTISFPASAGGEGKLVGNYLDLFDVRVVQPSYMRPLTRIERPEFSQYLTVQNVGIPTIYSTFRQLDQLWLRLWPIPSVDLVLLASVARVVEDVTDPAQNVDVPQEWTEWLYYGLAERLLPSTGVLAKEPQTGQLIMARAAELYRKVTDFDRPASYAINTWGRHW